MRNFIILLLSLLTLGISSVFAQKEETLNFKFSNEESYRLFREKKWKELADFGKKNYKAGIDFYYLNLRTGIANYSLGNYFEAIKYFELALDKNNVSELAKEYLYWSYLSIGDEQKASTYFTNLSKVSQQRINPDNFNLLKSIYVNTGLKSPSVDSVGDNAFYGNISFSHQLGKKLSWTNAFTYQSQDQLTFEWKQTEFYTSPTLLLGKGLYVQGAYHYAQTITDIDYTVDGLIENTLYNEIGTAEATNHIVYGSIGYKRKRFNINLLGYYYQQNSNYTLNGALSGDVNFELPEIPTETGADTLSVLELGANMSYTLPILGNRLGTGLEIRYRPEAQSFNYIPYAWFKATPKIWLNARYLEKEADTIMADVGGYLLFNASNPINSRLKVGVDWYVHKNISLHLDYINENITDNILETDFNTNGFFIGLTITK